MKHSNNKNILKNRASVHKHATEQAAAKHPEQKKDKVLAISALVCGLLSWIPLFNIVLGPLAVIFGILAIKRVKINPERYGGQAIAVVGLILGLIFVIFTIMYYYSLYVELFHPGWGILPMLNSTIVK
jgi:hypothetical protein